MSTPKDSVSQSDVGLMKREPDGSFKRPDSSFRDVIEKGGRFTPEEGRYHLYVAFSCPWATRTLIVRKLKGLDSIIPVTIVSPRIGPNGWAFGSVDRFEGAEEDPLYQSAHIKDLYFRADPNYSGRFTVPVLWDKKLHTIVNNESSEIIRIFNTAFNEFLPKEKAALNYYPEDLKAQIDELNDWIYPNINNGVYRAGFAVAQEPYERAVNDVFAALDKVEKVLEGKDYLVGNTLTEADIRLWVTIIRFDPVYHGLFKCNFRTIRSGYPAIHSWLHKLYWNNSSFKESTNFEHIKVGYYWPQSSNPTRIVPVGPIPSILPLSL
ncbi:hypothetical protein HYPSUDRAFT_40330 [Hypholoma sublateritium FD-334 SS-4]|uniref:GST C-terminal domain-containing protein n=1 Tax=Hypholoma sublateritium (strain FD-334 SS-4) TaxID=945553 RepID=A0A0D2MHP0_HYPSF|nr:hypothetical protein HYPSUDRAFT_40330 [Hypholoma sublateritium FD-334 SS-4]